VAPKDGVFNRARFEKAQLEYMEAVDLNTNNSMSTSVQCRFTRKEKNGQTVDAADIYRERISSSNLR
jgi:hypothetical protein